MSSPAGMEGSNSPSAGFRPLHLNGAPLHSLPEVLEDTLEASSGTISPQQPPGMFSGKMEKEGSCCWLYTGQDLGWGGVSAHISPTNAPILQMRKLRLLSNVLGTMELLKA